MPAGTTTTPMHQALLHGRHDVQDWWIPAFRGLFLLLGGFAFLFPGYSTASAGLLFAAVAMMGGGAVIHNARELRSIVPTMQGLVSFSLGALSILFVDGHMVPLIVCMSIWVTTTGAFDVFLAHRHRLLRGRRLLFSAGAVGIVGGIALFGAAVTAAPGWQRVFAVTISMQGLLLVSAGLRRSRRGAHVVAPSPAVREPVTPALGEQP